MRENGHSLASRFRHFSEATRFCDFSYPDFLIKEILQNANDEDSSSSRTSESNSGMEVSTI